MRHRIPALHIVLMSLLALPIAGPPARADEAADPRPHGQPKADSALVYFIREWAFAGGGRTFYFYADDTYAGVLDNDCYTFTYLPPGRHLVWFNPKNSALIEVEAGKTYYLNLTLGIKPIDEATGRRLIDDAEHYCTPDEDQQQDAVEEIRDNYPKVQQRAAGKPVLTAPVQRASQPAAPSPPDERRVRHVAQWPKVDLAPFDTLFVEDFAITDPKAADRSNESLVQTAPRRMPDMVVERLGTGVFVRVVRGTPLELQPGAVILRARVTQYKPGSKTARSVMIGLGSSQLEMVAELVDAASGKSLVQLPVDRSWAWGGALGGSLGITDMERSVATELALYLQQNRGTAPATPTGQQ